MRHAAQHWAALETGSVLPAGFIYGKRDHTAVDGSFIPGATQGTGSEKTQFLPYREQLGSSGELLRNADVQAPLPVIQVLEDSESSKK